MSGSFSQVLNSNNVEELQRVDSYLKLKNFIESELGFKLHVNGWVSLFERINFLKSTISKKKEELKKILNVHSFPEAKRQTAKILGFNIDVKEHANLRKALNSLVSLFSNTKMSAYERYEATKRKNFIHSSRLEGIEIPSQKSKQSLESILAKYRV